MSSSRSGLDVITVGDSGRNYRNYNTSSGRGRGSNTGRKNTNKNSSRRSRRRRRQLQRLLVHVVVIGVFCAIVIGIAIFLMGFNKVYKNVTIEAGETVTIADLLKDADPDAYFTADSADIAHEDGSLDTNITGEFEVFVKTGWKSHKVNITIEDTVAPQFDVTDVTTVTNGTTSNVKAADFASNIIDATTVEFSFEAQPDFATEGPQNVVIVGTDAGGNVTKKDAILTLSIDNEAPTISGSDFDAYVDESISYKSQIAASDNSGAELTIDVDTSAVDTATVGTYPVTYTVTDPAGNAATLTINVNIKEHSASEQSLFAQCDDILAGIITDSMSKTEQAKAIFDWIHANIGWYNDSEKGDWVKAAVDGLAAHRGDCYTYFSISKALLTRAGIQNMDIERIPEGDRMHYWNLIDVEDGTGWHHFDATPRVGHPDLFMRTDEWMREYSASHEKCFNYDESKYPDIY